MSGAAFGGVADATAYEKFRHQVTGPGKQSVNFGSNGTPVISPGVPTSVPDGAAGYKYTQTGSIPNPSGTPVPTTATGRVPNSAIAGAIGRFLSKVVTPITVGMAIYDLARELGFTVTNEDGIAGAELTRDVSNCVQASGCYWRTGADSDTTASTGPQSCHLWATLVYPAYNPYGVYEASTETSGFCRAYRLSNNAYINGVSVIRFGTPTIGIEASTIAELEAAIASQSGWPSTSKVASAAEAAAKANNETLPMPAPTVTGPATSTGTTKTTTSTNPDGSTKTTNVTNNYTHNYAGDTVTTTTTTTTSVTNNGTQGNNTTETTTETEKDDRDHCEKYPDSVGCAELGTPPGDEIPRSSVNLTYSAEEPFGGGSCPADKTMNLRGQTVKVIDWVKWCSLTATYVRPLIILLATISAFFIVAIGRDQS